MAHEITHTHQAKEEAPFMTTTDIAMMRLYNQQLSASELKTPQEIVAHMGAMQAQDFTMAKWAIGTRCAGCTEADVNMAIDRCQLIRTHVLRPTWHLVSSDDIYWMLELSAPQIKSILKSYDKMAGVHESVHAKSLPILEKALSGNKSLTRDELKLHLDAADIDTSGNKTSHILQMAETIGLICSGGTVGNKQKYSLLEERVPKTAAISREEALALLAKRYFTSHGPATLADFTWWSGLSISAAKKALESVKDLFLSEEVEGQTYWFPSHTLPAIDKKASINILPSFDEFLISYKDRTASISKENQKMAFSNNGIFWPIVLVSGQVVGNWKRTIKKDKLSIGVSYFIPQKKTIQKAIEDEFETYAGFLGKKLSIDPAGI